MTQTTKYTLTQTVNANPYQSFTFLGVTYTSLYDLCNRKDVAYTTVKDRLDNGFSLVDAVTQPRFTRSVEKDFSIVHLYSTKKWNPAEISQITGEPVTRVKAVIKKYKQLTH